MQTAQSPHFALDELERTFRRWNIGFGRRGRMFWSSGAEGRLMAHPACVPGWSVLAISTPVPFHFYDLRNVQLNLLNNAACCGALAMSLESVQSLRVRSSIPIPPPGRRPAPGPYIRLAARAALLTPVWVRNAWDYVSDQGTRWPQELRRSASGWDRWPAAHFAAAREELELRGFVATAGERGLTFECPWDKGSVSAAMGHRTMLVTIKYCTHPFMGNGLSYRVELPIAFQDTRAFGICYQANLRESNRGRGVPSLGAWCFQPAVGRPAFVGFAPNCMAADLTLKRLAQWLVARAQMSRVLIPGLVSTFGRLDEIERQAREKLLAHGVTPIECEDRGGWGGECETVS